MFKSIKKTVFKSNEIWKIVFRFQNLKKKLFSRKRENITKKVSLCE